MSEIRERFEDELKTLRGVRDDLEVRLHLGRAEIRDQWEKLEKVWSRAEAKLKLLREESRESADDIEEAARLLIDEIREGYRHLRGLL